MQVSITDYYIICLKFHFKTLFIIWVSDDIDGVLLDDASRIITFNSVDDLKQFSNRRRLILKPDLTSYDISFLQDWLVEPDANFDRLLFLNLWNLFIDLAQSLNVEFLGDTKNTLRNSIYDKLFDSAGPFIPEDPNPILNIDEVLLLSKILKDGLDTFLNNMSLNNPSL